MQTFWHHFKKIVKVTYKSKQIKGLVKILFLITLNKFGVFYFSNVLPELQQEYTPGMAQRLLLAKILISLHKQVPSLSYTKDFKVIIYFISLRTYRKM